MYNIADLFHVFRIRLCFAWNTPLHPMGDLTEKGPTRNTCWCHQRKRRISPGKIGILPLRMVIEAGNVRI